MPMLEKYRHYFNIDPDYFPAVNEAGHHEEPGSVEKILPPRDLRETSEEHGQRPGAQAEALSMGGRCLRNR